jgi:hypothetical protein
VFGEAGLTTIFPVITYGLPSGVEDCPELTQLSGGVNPEPGQGLDEEFDTLAVTRLSGMRFRIVSIRSTKVMQLEADFC